MSVRISVRLDPALAAKIREIRRRTGMATTEIVEAAIVAWTPREETFRPSPARAFAAAGFIGSGTGPRLLARDARASLRESLKKKT